MKKPQLLKPTELSNQGLAKRYTKHPGPYTITTGWEQDLERIFPGIMDIDFDMSMVLETQYGDMNQSETELLYRIVSWMEPKTLVEIGTFNGRSTKIMAEQSALDARVLTVELPEDTDFVHPYSTDVVFTERSKKGMRYIGSKDQGKIEQVYMDATSKEFAERLDEFLGEEKIDFALVDAAHDYHTTRTSFELVFDRLSEGGVILADDYGKLSTHVGVTEMFARKARKENLLLYNFKPEPTTAKDPSAIFFVNVEGAVRDWSKGE